MARVKLLTIVGARPQFIKAAVVSRALAERQARGVDVVEHIVHTGQHYDDRMSQVFFDEMRIPAPERNLEIHGGSHGAMTARMLEAVERAMLELRPDLVLIYGDTNSTLAGALAAAKLHIPVAHVEAGLRSFNMRMPEEINRIVADRLSALLFCPTDVAVRNLAAEGLTRGVVAVGDVMLDASLFYLGIARERSRIRDSLGLGRGAYALATVHRAENTDDPERLQAILRGLSSVAASMPVVLPLHPRTRQRVADLGLDGALGAVRVIEPVGYLDMLLLEEGARVIVTDSGGVQKEAYFLGVPCVTTRDETEWVETVDSGWNTLVGSSTDTLTAAVANARPRPARPAFYGDGRSGQKIADALVSFG